MVLTEARHNLLVLLSTTGIRRMAPEDDLVHRLLLLANHLWGVLVWHLVNTLRSLQQECRLNNGPMATTIPTIL
jgi:hypothetical protein